MKRRYVVLGLTVVLILVLFAALAGPASAGSDRWTPFEATFEVDWGNYVPPTFWPLWKGVDGFVPARSIDEVFPGQWNSSVAALNGYAVTETNGTATFQGPFKGDPFVPAFTFTMRYVNKTTLSVPGWGEWEITANGLYVYDFRTGLESHTLAGRGVGVSGSVKGWVMKFTADLAAGTTALGYYMEK